MNPPDDFLNRVESLFHRAKDVPASQRESFIRTQAAGDEDLCREVEAMLRAEASMNQQFLNEPVMESLQRGIEPGIQRVGSWAIENLIGTGGMGTVFRGRRADGAFDAEVAIKFIRETVIDPALRDRFLRERQILATLDHPNIARLLDGGVTERGQPYLVMELVHGEALLEYCDARRTTIDQRIAIFDSVCDAVQHAHGNLIVHRDLKPSNILVDASGRPRLLDFGIASMLDDADTAGMITATNERRFTPQYAAPEQVRGEPVTVATDVYALGMILYELLTGVRPYEVTGRHAPEDTRVICETNPPRPSRRLDAADRIAATDLVAIAQSRGTEPRRLRRSLHGDLDHIVMMALRKEPNRRYATVEAMRDDLRHFRQGLPVAARPDSWRYRTRRFISRHRVPMTAAAILAMVLVTAAIVSTTLALRLSEQTDALIQALDEANAQREAAEREFVRAQLGRLTLTSTLATLASADEDVRQSVIDDLLTRRKRLDAKAVPLTRATELATRQVLAELAMNIDAFDEALIQYQHVLALTEDHPEEASVRADAYFRIGSIYVQTGKAAEAIEVLPKAIEAQRTAHAFDHLYHPANELTPSHVLLMEAHLIVGDVAAAQMIVQQHEFPDPPTSPSGLFRRKAVRDLQARFNVPLMPDDAD